MVAQSGELALEMRRALPAEPSVVFAALSEPNELARWFGPQGLHDPEPGFRPSGRRDPTGSSCSRRMAARSILRGSSAKSIPPSASLTLRVGGPGSRRRRDAGRPLSLSDLGGSTEVDFTQGTFKTEARRTLRRDGWTDSFDKLEQLISAHA